MGFLGWGLMWGVFGRVKMGGIIKWGGAGRVLYKCGLGRVGICFLQDKTM